QGLDGEEVQVADQLALLFLELDHARGTAFVENRLQLREHGEARLRVLVAALGNLLGALDVALDGFEVRERELGVDDLDVGERIHLARDVHDVVVHEATHDLHDGIGFTDVRKELVAEALALRGAGDEACDVHELDRRRQHLLRLDDAGKHVETRIRNGHDTDIRIDGAEGIVFRGDLGPGEGVEEGGFADVGQAHDSTFNSHLHFLFDWGTDLFRQYC